jgi:transcriptional regulator with XRE-family HTH domain
MIDGELGAFLRSRREATNPGDVGLPPGSRRRTPGLRRAELATLAGISVDYLIRIEQGRDQHPSTQVLAALADALRLGPADRDHLQQLAMVSHGTQLLCAAARGTRGVRPSVHAILDALGATPAVVLDHRTELLAWNEGYDRLTRPVGLLDDSPPNLVWYTFTDPRARSVYPDWPDVADELVAVLHQRRQGDPDTDTFAARLAEAAGTEFTTRWSRRPVHDARTGVRALEHPQVGQLRLAAETLDLANHDRCQLVVHLPADATTATGLNQLAGHQPGMLRSVGD